MRGQSQRVKILVVDDDPQLLCHRHYSDHVGMFYAVVLEGSSCQEGIVERLSLAERAAFSDVRLRVTDMW